MKPRRRAPKRTFRATAEGKVFLAVTLGVGVAAVNTGNNLLYLVLGLMLSLLLVSGVLSDLALHRIRARRRLDGRLFAGETAMVEVVLENRKGRLASHAIEVRDELDLDGRDATLAIRVPPGSEATVRHRIVPDRRGWLRSGGCRIVTRHPFGLIEKGRLLDAPIERVVYPRRVTADDGVPDAVVDDGSLARPRAGHGTEAADLRDHRPSDEARSIHWRRSASLGRLISRERAIDEAPRLVVVFDERLPEDASTDEAARFEERLARAASSCLVASQRGDAVELRARGKVLTMAPGDPVDAALRHLALLDVEPPPEERR